MIYLVEKKEIDQGWPFETGDYAVGDYKSPVAAISLGSKMNDELVDAGVAIAGSLHTENLGIEKVVANIVSNPNIRYVLLCGSEVQGHITGETVEALYENGIDPEKKAIIGSPGAIPFVENLPIEAVERFQDQVSIISMINNENMDDLSSKIKECIDNDPGAYSKDPFIVELNESEDEEDEEVSEDIVADTPSESVGTTSLYLVEIENRIKFMQGEIKEIASQEKFTSGYYAGKIEGIVIGFILTLILVLMIIRGM